MAAPCKHKVTFSSGSDINCSEWFREIEIDKACSAATEAPLRSHATERSVLFICRAGDRGGDGQREPRTHTRTHTHVSATAFERRRHVPSCAAENAIRAPTLAQRKGAFVAKLVARQVGVFKRFVAADGIQELDRVMLEAAVGD